jgi:hypothetical protein
MLETRDPVRNIVIGLRLVGQAFQPWQGMIGIVPTGVEFRHGEGIAGRVFLFEYRNLTLSIGFSTKRVVYKR